MDGSELLVREFEAHRAHLKRVAFRMLGSEAEAEDAVQESWLRVSRAGDDAVTNIGGWLTTIVGRVCLDVLRSRSARREESLQAHEPEPATGHRTPEEDVQLADSVGLALLVVLEALEPAERVAFVLHDMFDIPFDDIAPIVGRSSVATRQLASRARRRVQGASPAPADRDRHVRIVEAFLAASRAGDFEALVAILDPDVVLTGDAQAVRMHGPAELRGATAVASIFNGRAQAAVPGLLDGRVGVLVPVKGRMLLVFEIRFGSGGTIASIDVVAERDSLAAMELTTIDGGDPLH